MNLDDVSALLTVVEHGSIQRAAQAIRASRSALGRQLERLEADLDVQLLVRGSRGVDLTPAGQELVRRAPGLLREASLVSERVQQADTEARGTLRFIVPVGMPVGPRARALAALRRLQPDLSVDVVEDEDPVARRNEPFDLLLHLGKNVSEAGWFSQVLARLPMMLQATDAYIKTHGMPTSVHELDAHQIAYFVAPDDADPKLPIRRRKPMPIAPWVCSSNLTLLVSLAESGAALVYAPVLPIAVGGSARLTPVLSDEVRGQLTLRALSPRSSRVDARIRAMLKNAKALLAHHQNH